MPNWLLEMLNVLERSKKTQLAIYLGVFFFIGILLVGSYALSGFELHGPAKGMQNAIIDIFAKRYEKLAFLALISFWVIAYKSYQKDKK